jgi:CheY-like chemotaxis protein
LNWLKHEIKLRVVPKTILIADDRASMRRSVRFLLERRHSDLVVQEAVDGVEAIELAKQAGHSKVEYYQVGFYLFDEIPLW